MTRDHQLSVAAMFARFWVDRPRMSPADWCCQNLIFQEPDNHGPWSLVGRQYMREPVDDWADADITDQVEVFGSQTGKTGGIMAGAAWTICNSPSRIFWVQPTRETSSGFSRTRWQTMLIASPETRLLIPTGAKRHDFSTFRQIIGNAIVDMVWSNSPAALASVPARVVILDEVDKFDQGGKREADSVNLAEQRTKSFSNPKRVKTSTPTLTEGLIWQEFLKTDQRRRFCPCPHCGKFVVLIWSQPYTVFKKLGCEAPVRWDKEARRPDKSWDLDRVERSARFECPHCGGHIRDGHKTAMDRGGEWRPTATAARGYRGRHLPSLYASSAQTNVGKLAVKFLQAKRSLLGLQGFINGDLAEPYQAQDTLGDRTELVTSRLEVTAEWQKIMTVDCQARAPFFWYVVRAWSGGSSTGVEAGPLDTWDEVRARQEHHKIPDVAVTVDSGFGARSDAEVYKECARHSEMMERPDALPLAIGWMPSKGMPGRKRWRDKETGLMLSYYLGSVDPFSGTSLGGRCEMNILQFSGDLIKDILEGLRRGKSEYKWTVAESMATDEYWRHMDAEVKAADFNRRTGKTTHTWRPRSSHWPNHLFDCEVLQIVTAIFMQIFDMPDDRPE